MLLTNQSKYGIIGIRKMTYPYNHIGDEINEDI